MIWHDGSVFGLGLVHVALLAAEAEDGPLVVGPRGSQRVDRVGARGLSEERRKDDADRKCIFRSFAIFLKN